MTKNIVPVINIANGLGLASRHSRDPAWLTITNYTKNTFSVQWIDYDGMNQPCEPSLEAFATFTQQTFATHPFVLTDSTGVLRYLVVPVKGDCVAHVEPNDIEMNESSILLLPEPLENTVQNRSLNSDATCFLTIVNRTDKEHKMIWLDFDGHRIEYASIKSHETRRHYTFETHPWILGQVDSSRESLYFPKRGACRIELYA